MVDMKRSPDAKSTEMATDYEEPQYPYGLCLTLGKDELEKKMNVMAMGYVKSTSAYETQDDGKSMSVEIQLTDLELSPGERKDPAEVMYGQG